jgi:pimeloyl-ACP methyl ester carboxylesterase
MIHRIAREFALIAAIVPMTANAFPVDFGPDFTTRQIAVDGATISVTVGGRGPVVVLLHGYAEDSRMWKPLAVALAPRFTAQEFGAFAHTKLTIPVLSIGGDKSLGGALGKQARLVATHVRVVVLKNCGHWIIEEQPKQTMDALVSFLTRPR